mgnify:CR=1 FL=1
MSKIVPLKAKTTVSRVAIFIKQSKQIGDLYALRNFLRKQKELTSENIEADNEKLAIYIDDISREKAEEILNRYESGLSNGHGGYRISFEVIEQKDDLMSILKQKNKGEHEAEINRINKLHSKEQEAWSIERKSLEKEVKNKDLINDVICKNITKLENKNKKLETKLNTYQIPIFKIAWRRLKKLIC